MSEKICVKKVKIEIVEVDTSKLSEEELKILNCLCSCEEVDNDDKQE